MMFFSFRSSLKQVFLKCRRSGRKIPVTAFIFQQSCMFRVCKFTSKLLLHKYLEKIFSQIFSFLSRFLDTLRTALSQNIFHWRLLAVVRCLKYPFPPKLYTQGLRLGAEKI